jgi:hypothetical protein
MIDHNSRLILIEAAYDGDSPPVNLIAEFGATGTVTVNGVTQTNGSSSVNFSGPVVYIVFNPSNPTLKREYRVEVKFVKSLSSVAEIETFSFYAADNPDLLADVHAMVNQTTGAITATLLFDKNLPGGNRTLIPRWTAQGRVESNGVTLTSGGLNRQFYTSLPLRAISADSGFRKDYTVTIKEVNSRIYVRQNATGRNDGTNWQNAYRSVNDVVDDVSLFPDANSKSSYVYDNDDHIIILNPIDFIFKEIWIAEGTYALSERMDDNIYNFRYLPSHTSLIGGFRGNEASVSARVDPANHRAVISNGDQGEVYMGVLMVSGSLHTISPSSMSIEDLVFTNNYGNFSSPMLSISRPPAAPSSYTVIIKGVEFRDFTYNALDINCCDDVIITDCSFSNSRVNENPDLAIGSINSHLNSNITISNCSFTNVRTNDGGGAIYVYSTNYDTKATVTNCNFVNASSARNVGNAMFFNGCSSVTESGNTFTNVPSPTVTIGNWGDYW